MPPFSFGTGIKGGGDPVRSARVRPGMGCGDAREEVGIAAGTASEAGRRRAPGASASGCAGMSKRRRQGGGGRRRPPSASRAGRRRARFASASGQ